VRRRRECLVCAERFTTYESAELNLPRVVKGDGRASPSTQEAACGDDEGAEKRPVSTDQVDAAVARITGA